MGELTRKQLYDRVDPDWRVLKLTRAGHHLWALKRLKSVPPDEERAFQEALETIWALKVRLKAEIEAERVAESVRVGERFKESRAA